MDLNQLIYILNWFSTKLQNINIKGQIIKNNKLLILPKYFFKTLVAILLVLFFYFTFSSAKEEQKENQSLEQTQLVQDIDKLADIEITASNYEYVNEMVTFSKEFHISKLQILIDNSFSDNKITNAEFNVINELFKEKVDYTILLRKKQALLNNIKNI